MHSPWSAPATGDSKKHDLAVGFTPAPGLRQGSNNGHWLDKLLEHHWAPGPARRGRTQLIQGWRDNLTPTERRATQSPGSRQEERGVGC